uniref:Uncharacterized protein n=1 Tax=Sphaerodactylus townsendi TaxID=933632 RepID=A0ACB8FGP2_9SAUR
MTRLGKPSAAAILAAPPVSGLFSYHVNRSPPGARCGVRLSGHRQGGWERPRRAEGRGTASATSLGWAGGDSSGGLAGGPSWELAVRRDRTDRSGIRSGSKRRRRGGNRGSIHSGDDAVGYRYNYTCHMQQQSFYYYFPFTNFW